MSDSPNSIGGLIASGLIAIAALGASFFSGALWERTQHQVKDLKATAAAATDTTNQTIKNAGTSSAEEGKLEQNGKDIAAAVDTAKQRIDRLPKPVTPACVPDLTGKGYVIINAPEPDSYWRAFADGYNSVLDQAEGGAQSAAVHPVDGAGELRAAPPESQ